MAAGNPVKIRLAGSGYSAQLRGKAGTATAGEVIQGSYDSGWQQHVFLLLKSGFYDLYVDPAGGSTYSKDSVWSGDEGKVVTGRDLGKSFG